MIKVKRIAHVKLLEKTSLGMFYTKSLESKNYVLNVGEHIQTKGSNKGQFFSKDY